jgi:anti-sigma factor RsiW
MIDCANGELRDQLPEFIHNRLDPATRAEVAAHVAACAACAAELALLQELRASLQTTPDVDVARIVAALPAPSRAARPVRRLRLTRLDWSIAAALALVAIGGGSAAILSGRLRIPEGGVAPVTQQTPVAAATVSLDADLAEATTPELEALFAGLEAFDGLPAGEPEQALAPPVAGEEGL